MNVNTRHDRFWVTFILLIRGIDVIYTIYLHFIWEAFEIGTLFIIHNIYLLDITLIYSAPLLKVELNF